jgi:hypothetical protein
MHALPKKVKVNYICHEIQVSPVVDILHIQLAVTVLLSLLQLFSTLTAYIRSLKERQSQKQDRHKIILGNPLGEENPTNFF